MRVAVICPGRGTYTKSELGSLTRAGNPVRDDLVRRADLWRDGVSRQRVSDLDRADRFGARHLAGENAAALIYTGSAADFVELLPSLDIVAVCGNSMGWYTALHVAGVFDFETGLRLADTLGSYQSDGLTGGQVIVPIVDESWRPDGAAAAEVTNALDACTRAGYEAWPSIHLGGYEVLGGTSDAVRLLLEALPKRTVGRREYPFQLLGHSAFHTPLMEPTSARAKAALADLPWTAPSLSLVDGRGHVFRPLATSKDQLFEYTLGHQIVEPFDFTTSVRVVLRHFAPEALVLLGPGDTLGGALGQILVQEGWQGLRHKRDFLERQESDRPLLYALARPEQAATVSSAANS